MKELAKTGKVKGATLNKKAEKGAPAAKEEMKEQDTPKELTKAPRRSGVKRKVLRRAAKSLAFGVTALTLLGCVLRNKGGPYAEALLPDIPSAAAQEVATPGRF